jgi:flagellar FliL protein
MAAKETAPAPAAAEGEAPAPTGMKAKLPMIAMVAVGLAIGGGTGAAVVGPMVAKKMGKATPPHADSASAAGEAGGEAAGGEKAAAEGEKGKEGAEPAVHLLENLVLNPAQSQGTRFLLFSVAIETGAASAAADLTAHDAELRDIILTSLGTKTVEQLSDMSTREGIKTDVQAAIVKRFGKSAVKRLYFPQFVVQ